MKIQSDEQYETALSWLVDRAKLIEDKDKAMKNPLAKKQDKEQWRLERAEHMRKYDLVTDELLSYNSNPRWTTIGGVAVTKEEEIILNELAAKPKPRTAMDDFLS